MRKRAQRSTQPVKAFWLDPSLRLEENSLSATNGPFTSTSKLKAEQQIKNINNTATIVNTQSTSNINTSVTKALRPITLLPSPIPVAVFGAGKDFIVDREGVEETATFLGVSPVFLPDLYHDVRQSKLFI